ncbi:MAG TPA: serine hydrolase domain-containing protein [Pyrinomonadaceae bacterium]
MKPIVDQNRNLVNNFLFFIMSSDMQQISRFILLFLVILTVVTGVAAQDQTAAERQGRAFIEAISTGDRSKVRRFVEANFASEMLGLPMEQHLNFASNHYDSSRGYEVVSVQETIPNGATLLLKNKLTGSYAAMAFMVEDKTPFKIRGIGSRPPKAPAAANRILSNADISKELEGFLKRLADADVFSGAVLLAKDGVPVYKAAYGTANKDYGVPNKIDTKFNLGSMNKMFTAVSVAQLVEKGKLSFDDPLSKFIPDFPDSESAKKIQIKHLLSHTAGLGPYFTKRYQDMSRNKLRTVDDMMALAKQDEKLLFEPGSKWQYSNTGMLVLGKIIEIVSGQSYFDYVRENIYKPAGMINTDAYELDKVNPNLAVGYHKTFTDNGIVWSNNVFQHVMRGGPQGGGYSTVEDLLRFDQALRGGKLVSPAMVKVLTTPKPELNSRNYGYGFNANTAEGTAGHGGGFTGIHSNLNMFLNSGWTAIIMSNYSLAGFPVMEKMDSLIKQSESKAAVADKK